MSKNVLKALPELISAGLISEQTAENIKEYFHGKEDQSQNRLFIAFGILGAILIGLGIILIVAHNWDSLSRTTKTIFAFLPMIAGQLVCGFTLLKKKDSVTWRESSATFLIFTIGACIILVAQIYNIPGELGSFLLTWCLLSLPLIYLMRSSVASLLYLIGITWYACEVGYWNSPASEPYLYWLLLLFAIPHYYLLIKKQPDSNFLLFHNWFIPLSVIITLGTVTKDTGELMSIAYFSLFGLLYLLGKLRFFKDQRPYFNGYFEFGILGTLIMLLIYSFDWFWKEELSIRFF